MQSLTAIRPAMIALGCLASSLATLTLELADEYDGKVVEG